MNKQVGSFSVVLKKKQMPPLPTPTSPMPIRDCIALKHLVWFFVIDKYLFWQVFISKKQSFSLVLWEASSMLSEFLLDVALYIYFANNLVRDRVFCIIKNYFGVG